VTKLYRDTEGRVRTETSFTTPSGTTRTNITIIDPVAGFIAHLNPSDSTAIKTALHTPPSGAPKDRPTPPSDASTPKVVTTDLPQTTIAGLPATGKLTTITIPAGAIGNTDAITMTREVWTSTALQVVVKATINDPMRGTTNVLLSDVSSSTPDASLFQIPSNYTVKDAPKGGRHGGAGLEGPPPPFEGGSL
jgi:hypothetical protein